MTSKLKPCPFCGGDALIHSKALADGFGTAYWAACEKCGKGDTLPSFTEEEAAAAWNTRAERICKNVEFDSTRNFECSECGFSVTTVPKGPSDWLTYSWGYCPSCGAKVVE